MAKVAVVKGDRGLEPVYRALDLVDYRSALGELNRVLIKVNFITTKSWETGATTDPLVVEAIVNKIRDTGREVIIVESDAMTTNADKACTISGMRDMCNRIGVRFINLRHEVDRIEVPVQNPLRLKTITLPRLVTESIVISAAKLKTHMETGVSLNMKNMFGLLPDKLKGRYHLLGIDKVIVDVNSIIKPALNIIDGFVAMEGRGPVHGRPLMMNTIIAGTNPVATDATATRAMGFDPQEIKHIKWANKKGLGEINNIDVLGDGLEAVMKKFSTT